MRRVDSRIRTETRALYECPRRQALLGDQRAMPCHQWIRKIAQGELEGDSVLLEDPDYVLLPDIRKRNAWGGGDATSVNLLVIFRDAGLHTIRDLRGEHLPTLERIQSNVLDRVQAMCGGPRDELYCYFNYLPSNPVLLHLHIAWPLPNNRDALRHHLLSTVIFNLGVRPDYYAQCPLPFAVYRGTRPFEESPETLTI